MKITDKHAYLIMAHNDPYCFHKLISLLDDKRNDIYIHIDKKSDINLFNDVKVKYSNIYFTNRIDVQWGSYSQIKTELTLLYAAASHRKYVRYHLLSGVDLPLKTQNEIHKFFDIYNSKEFVGYAPPRSIKDISFKTEFIHIGIRNYRSNSVVKKIFSHVVHDDFINLQKLIHYRIKHDIEIKKGANWFSITNELAQFILQNEDLIKKTFRYGLCIDEMFVQTLLWNSPFKDRIYSTKDEFEGCMRLIDWNRGDPWIWKDEDLETLIKSNRMFARKFSSKVDRKIIDHLCNYLLGRQ